MTAEQLSNFQMEELFGCTKGNGFVGRASASPVCLALEERLDLPERRCVVFVDAELAGIAGNWRDGFRYR